jgi:hypothetical protein
VEEERGEEVGRVEVVECSSSHTIQHPLWRLPGPILIPPPSSRLGAFATSDSEKREIPPFFTQATICDGERLRYPPPFIHFFVADFPFLSLGMHLHLH